MKDMKQAQGITEQLKVENALEWIGRMNHMRACAMEIVLLLLLPTLVVTICGICSFNTAHAYNAINQDGETIKMWGAGIYAYNSYFTALIFIGSDFTILIFAIPMAARTFIKARKTQSVEYMIRSFGGFCLLLYYSANLAFGVTYNYLHLAYIALFSLCFFGVWLMLAELHTLEVRREIVCLFPFTKGCSFGGFCSIPDSLFCLRENHLFF